MAHVSNLNIYPKNGFQLELYIKFIRDSKHDVDSVAQKMGLSKDTLYRYVRGALAFPIDRLPDLVMATGDMEFLNYFANKCGMTIMPIVKNRQTAQMMIFMAQMFLSASGGGEEKFLRRQK